MDHARPSPVDIGLGTGLRALIATLDGGVQSVYDELGVDFRPRFYSVLRDLQAHGELSVTALTHSAGVTQPAMTQTLAMMRERDLVEQTVDPDGRKRVFVLTRKGIALAVRTAPVFEATHRAARALQAETGHDLEAAITATLAALGTRDFAARIHAELAKGDAR
ncbi:MarR family winged helix-turn-helix transcriptional regulator [Sphingomicrobium aestuariivivum]|uniref:MarR family winged helix-turn-helix transcriptional regulator n=1 Tax=Sphingomicrobium aestuariivivum TaxID=1582356 RepID=UPI001FD6931A|nr:MarR family winged helix-turn-helix transcriptional regulator [Sphingomicrobium aestuariivivum]MCJ8190614.1 MarR family winged helix-turn-helix transcriptional regulator [Sphingomicrobium aestuariivivum]